MTSFVIPLKRNATGNHAPVGLYNPRHPIMRDIAFYQSGRLQRNQVNNDIGDGFGSAQVLSNALGIVSQNFTNANNQAYGWQDSPIVTSDGLGTGNFTYVFWADPIAENRASMPVGQLSNGAANNGVYFVLNGVSKINFFTLSTNDGSGQTFIQSASGITYARGDFHFFVARRIGSIMQTFIDARLHDTVDGSVRNILASTNEIAIGKQAGTVNSNRANASIPFTMAWNRALSDSEIAYMYYPQTRWEHVIQPDKRFILDAADAEPVDGRIMGGLVGYGGLAGPGGLAGQYGGLVG